MHTYGQTGRAIHPFMHACIHIHTYIQAGI